MICNLSMWSGAGLNRRHQDFQSCALPTELPLLFLRGANISIIIYIQNRSLNTLKIVEDTKGFTVLKVPQDW